jgi:type II secretory pathway pseudopilin PulG
MIVVVLGILSATAIPKFGNITESAKYAACRSNLGNIPEALEMCSTENGNYPGAFQGTLVTKAQLHSGLCTSRNALSVNNSHTSFQNHRKKLPAFQNQGLEWQVQKKPRMYRRDV